MNQEKCIGKNECGAKCLKVCPWGAPQFSAYPNAKMRKCDLCYDRLEEGKQTICVDACPMYALDVGPIDQLKQKYGTITNAIGFKNNEKIRPSIIFKSEK